MDKEWLAKANLMATTGGKAYLMVLSDILQLAESPEYSSHPKQQPGELVGFTVPDWMIEKMKAYIETAKTNPETTDEELLRIAEEYAEMEEDSKLKKVCRDQFDILYHFSVLAVPGEKRGLRDQPGLGHGQCQHLSQPNFTECCSTTPGREEGGHGR